VAEAEARFNVQTQEHSVTLLSAAAPDASFSDSRQRNAAAVVGPAAWHSLAQVKPMRVQILPNPELVAQRVPRCPSVLDNPARRRPRTRRCGRFRWG
jgi:hypothetical protein